MIHSARLESLERKYLGKERSVIITYTPVSASKQAKTFAEKLEAMRPGELLAMQTKVENKVQYCRNEEVIRERYIGFYDHLHMSPQLYELKFERSRGG